MVRLPHFSLSLFPQIRANPDINIGITRLYHEDVQLGKGLRERTLALMSQLIWYLTKQHALKETPPQKKKKENEKERGDAPPDVVPVESWFPPKLPGAAAAQAASARSTTDRLMVNLPCIIGTCLKVSNRCRFLTSFGLRSTRLAEDSRSFVASAVREKRTVRRGSMPIPPGYTIAPVASSDSGINQQAPPIFVLVGGGGGAKAKALWATQRPLPRPPPSKWSNCDGQCRHQRRTDRAPALAPRRAQAPSAVQSRGAGVLEGVGGLQEPGLRGMSQDAAAARRFVAGQLQQYLSYRGDATMDEAINAIKSVMGGRDPGAEIVLCYDHGKQTGDAEETDLDNPKVPPRLVLLSWL
ncbi:hypothetical protein BC826DRAFT_1179359 [Russula brevipes]|nr:hypothetical protein BC826DRAFT_1179359 [Russula brevipes]